MGIVSIVGAIFAVILLVSIAFVPTVMEQAESQNKEYADATKNPNKVSTSEEGIKKAMEKVSETSKNMNVLKETDKEKIVSFKKDDGSIAYAIFWKDEKNSNKIYFAVVDPNELVTKKLVSATSLNDSAAVAATISAYKTSFANGSYIETYGTTITGGLHTYFSPKDAGLLANGSSVIAGALAAGLGIFVSLAVSIALGAMVTLGVQIWYWYESNSDGSLDVRIPYANIATALTGHVYMKIGSHRYTI
ncbi:hypothetical protein MSBRW_1980 [Methanosarcina barkeri str. Wiesmoor]|uniref:Uncharacterized protein n=2 Tax=Methanosarcina barkeri TaxID=2208 RepID=A0A0E3QK36_METBA|nr:hypothetical protein MSBRW_1980 [Methanosarcina barkeri str. Wiesmoor]